MLTNVFALAFNSSSHIRTFFQPPQKKQKDKGGPKRPMSAYMLWLNSSRERIKSENPGISVTEISKKAGEMWRQLGKDEKEVRDEKHQGYVDCATLWFC